MMNRKKMMGMCMVVCLAGLAGCGKKEDSQTEQVIQLSEMPTESGEKGNSVEEVTGQGFKPPEGSHIDKRGFIVDKEGNTFDKEGGWQVPEGGHVDSKGRIIDKNGNVMGGGAPVGSKG